MKVQKDKVNLNRLRICVDAMEKGKNPIDYPKNRMRRAVKAFNSTCGGLKAKHEAGVKAAARSIDKYFNQGIDATTNTVIAKGKHIRKN